MTFPNNNDPSATNYLQGVILAEVGCTVFVYIVFKIIHYLAWGYEEDAPPKEDASSQQKEPDQRNWDQKGWNIYFPIILGNHIASLAVPIIYFPQIVTAVLGFVHFGLFAGILVINLCIRQLEPGKGGKTIVSRILWTLMCLINMILMVCGMVGINRILV